MNCVVTGGSGYIGSHLVQKLLDNNHEVSVLDIRKPIQDIKWIKKDLLDLDAFPRGTDVVFHLAAVANARKCAENPTLCFKTNISGTLNVLKAALKSDVKRVLLASSSWVAGCQDGDVVNEKSLFNLQSINTIYGATKLSQEQLCYSFYGDYGGPKYTIMRYGIPYGERMWNGLVVKAFMEMAERDKIISIMGDGKQGRNFLYVGDLCDAQILAMLPIAENKIYNFSGKEFISIETLAKEIAKHFPAKINFIPQARIEPKIKRIDSWLAENELGWVPRTSISDGIKKCIEWWRGLTPEQKKEQYWA